MVKAIDMKPECLTSGCKNVTADNFTDYCYRCACRDPLSHNAGREHGQASCHCLVGEPVKWDQPFSDHEKENAVCELADILGDYLFDPEDAWLAARGIITYLLPDSEHDIVRLTVLNGLEAVDKQHAQKRIEQVVSAREWADETIEQLGLQDHELNHTNECLRYAAYTGDPVCIKECVTAREQLQDGGEKEHVINMIAARFEQEDLPEDQININPLARIAFEVVADYYNLCRDYKNQSNAQLDTDDEVEPAEPERIRDVDRELIRRTTQQPIREGPAADLDIEDFHHRHRHQLGEDIEFYLSCSSCGATVDEECDYSCPKKDNRKERIRNYMKTSESMVNEAISDGLTIPCMRCGHIPHVDYRVDDQFWREATNEDERLNVVCIECLARDNPDIALHIEEIQVVSGTITTLFHPSKVVPHEKIRVKDPSEPCDDFEAAKDYLNICTWCGHKDKHHDEDAPIYNAEKITNPKRGHGSDTTVTSAEVPPPTDVNQAYDYSSKFDQLFYKHPSLREITVSRYDITVFFMDSDEPFPLTSLKIDSELRIDVEAVIYLDENPGMEKELYEFVEAVASGPCQCIPDAIGHFCRAHKAKAVLRRLGRE